MHYRPQVVGFLLAPTNSPLSRMGDVKLRAPVPRLTINRLPDASQPS